MLTKVAGLRGDTPRGEVGLHPGHPEGGRSKSMRPGCGVQVRTSGWHGEVIGRTVTWGWGVLGTVERVGCLDVEEGKRIEGVFTARGEESSSGSGTLSS